MLNNPNSYSLIHEAQKSIIIDESLPEALCNPSKGIKQINSGKSRFTLAHSATEEARLDEYIANCELFISL